MTHHLTAAGYGLFCLAVSVARFAPQWLRKGGKR